MSGGDRSFLVGAACVCVALLGYLVTACVGDADAIGTAFTAATCLLGIAGGIGVALVLVD